MNPIKKGIEFATADFADALLMMPLVDRERKIVIVQGASRWNVFRYVALGLTARPLGSSLTQVTCLSWEAQLRCYVNDLGPSIAGVSRSERSGIPTRAPLMWSFLGVERHWLLLLTGRSHVVYGSHPVLVRCESFRVL